MFPFLSKDLFIDAGFGFLGWDGFVTGTFLGVLGILLFEFMVVVLGEPTLLTIWPSCTFALALP